jgi:hypothetical protein
MLRQPKASSYFPGGLGVARADMKSRFISGIDDPERLAVLELAD